MEKYDVIVIGAGAAGMMAAVTAAKKGAKVLVLDMGSGPLRKVFVSGGGRCNFTNSAAGADRYFGENPQFVISSISGFSPSDMLDWVRSHGLGPSEKSPGQYFCGEGAGAFVNALSADACGVEIITGTQVEDVCKVADGYTVISVSASDLGAGSREWIAPKVIVATGGVSYASLGVSDIGYKIAKKFGHNIVPPAPGLVGLKTDAFGADFSGISIMAEISSGDRKVRDSLLFTHSGLGGPAAYRASLFDLSVGIEIDFMPGKDMAEILVRTKKTEGGILLSTILSADLPKRFVEWIIGDLSSKRMADCKVAALLDLAARMNRFKIAEVSRRGFDGAEITMGGVSTDGISSKTFESKLASGLYFAGEVLDIAGDLGGFNLHFAFASGVAAGNAV